MASFPPPTPAWASHARTNEALDEVDAQLDAFARDANLTDTVHMVGGYFVDSEGCAAYLPLNPLTGTTERAQRKIDALVATAAKEWGEAPEHVHRAELSVETAIEVARQLIKTLRG